MLVHEGRCQGSPLGEGVTHPIGGEHLDADVVGSGVAVGLDALADRGIVAPGDEGVDETVAAAVGEIVVGEPDALPVVRVVGEAEVRRQVQTRNGAGSFGVRVEDDGLL